MKVYIQTEHNSEHLNINTYSAFYGFEKMGFEIERFKDTPDNSLREDIVVGYISAVKTGLRNLGITPPNEIDYPEELKSFYGRKIWEDKLHNIANDPNTWPVFIKPKNGKQFDGRLVQSTKDLIGCAFGVERDKVIDIWCSEPIKIVSEWRCFVYYDHIIDIRPYKGTWKKQFNSNTIEIILETLKKGYNFKMPVAYTIDIGVTDYGSTIVIEINDGYSVGCYGLQPHLYAKFISARWCEMVGVPDQCKF